MSTWTRSTPSSILASLGDASKVKAAAKTISERALNISSISKDCLGIMPSVETLQSFNLPAWEARRAAGKLAVPMYTAGGHVKSFRIRSADGSPIILAGGRESKSVAIGGSSGAVMATRGGLALLRGESKPTTVVIGEGEGDLWAWDMLSPDVAYFGSVSGSACESIAALIPDGANVILRQHLDDGGNQMAEKWARHLEGRTSLWRLSVQSGRLDDGDRWKAGTLNTSDPLSDCRQYVLPMAPDPEADYHARRDAILESSLKFPPTWESVRLSQRYTACVMSAVSNMMSASKGGRAVTIHRIAHGVAGLCSAAEDVLEGSDASTLVSDARQLLNDAALTLMPRERKRALAQVKSGWKSGSSRPLYLEDTRIEPSQLNKAIQRRKAAKRKLAKSRKTQAAKETGAAVRIEDIPNKDLLTPRNAAIPEIDGMSLDEVRAQLAQSMEDAMSRNGVSIIIAPCGAGKSYVAKRQIVERIKDHRGDRRAVVSMPTKDLGKEIAEGFREEADSQGAEIAVEEAITRSPANCINFDVIKTANAGVAGGGSEYCRKICPLGWGQWKSEDGSETPCPWARANKSSEDADVLVNTHALEMKREALSDDEDALLRIDWPSFEHIADQGINAEPIVIRSNSFSIRATAATGGGSSVPKAELVQKSSLTTQSKRDILTWFLSYYKIEIEEGKEADDKLLREAVNNVARDLTGTNEETKVFVRWTAIADVSATGGMFPLAVPTVEINKEGWLSGVHVSIRLLEDGEAFPEIEVNNRMTRSDNSRQDVIDWISKAWDCPGNREALKEAAISRVTIHPVDVTVFDESLWGQALKGGDATSEQLGKCIATGEIAGKSSAILLQLIGECMARNKAMYSEEILSRIPVDSLQIDPGRTGKMILEALKPSQHKEKHLELLEGLIPWVVTEGLYRALEQNWRGVMITKTGRISVAWIKPIETRHSRTTICLDATATPEVAKACFGGREVNITKIELARPDGMKILWVPIDSSTSSNAFSGNSKIATQKMLAMQIEFGGKESLVISHKKHVEAGKYVFKEIAKDGSALLHHNGTLARGSNKFEDLSTAIIHDYHAPRGAIRIQAEALAIQSGEDFSKRAVKEKLEQEVRHQLEIAPVRQATQRIRANLATESNTKTLVFVSTMSPARFGYYPDKVVDPDELAHKHLGITLPNNRKEIMQDLFAHIKEGGFMPTIAAISPNDVTLGDLIPQETKDGLSLLVTTHGDELLNSIKVDQSSTVSRRLMTYCKSLHAGSWTSFAKYCGIKVAMIETSRGGKASPYLYQGELDRNDIHQWMTSRKIVWWRIEGETEKVYVQDFLEVFSPMVKITEEMLVLGSVGDLLHITAAKLDTKVSARTARRMFDRYRNEGESMKMCIVRIWQAVHATYNAESVKTLVNDGGLEVEEAVAQVEATAKETPSPWMVYSIAKKMSDCEDAPEWAIRHGLAKRGDTTKPS